MRMLMFSMFALTAGTLGCSHHATVARTPPPPSPPPVTVVEETIEVTEMTVAPADCGEIRVHFPFDSTVIEEEDRPQLASAGDCLLAQEKTRVVIQGNADERGTVEYNIALGQRRADAVREYLERMGIPDGLVSTVSYGEERPLCHEHNEECWQRNRNAAVVPQGQTGGVSQLK